MRRTLILLLLIPSILNVSCQGSGKKNSGTGASSEIPGTGKVIPSVNCLNNSTVSYSLYLPSGYSGENKYPVYICFDPHAAGNLPVEKYDSLAGKFGYILIGSNNSKNGLPGNETQSIAGALLGEAKTRYSVDTTRIYLLGFSGGSRIASMLALYGGGIRGVIGCGAGFPGSDQPAQYRFDFIGLAGTADFNMNELVNLDEQLDNAGFRHALLLFDGKHEWPPAEKMEEAFTWNQFCAMKDGTIPKDDDLISQYIIRKKERIMQDEKTGDLYREADDMTQMIRFLDGLQNTDDLKKELSQLRATPEFKKAEAAMNIIREKEMNEQRMYAENFYLKDLDWWRRIIMNYELRITKSKDEQDVLMCKRIMSYLSLLAYMQYSGANSAGNKDKADFALEVYRIVDPENASKIK
jgi:predicted esterase